MTPVQTRHTGVLQGLIYAVDSQDWVQVNGAASEFKAGLERKLGGFAIMKEKEQVDLLAIDKSSLCIVKTDDCDRDLPMRPADVNKQDAVRCCGFGHHSGSRISRLSHL